MESTIFSLAAVFAEYQMIVDIFSAAQFHGSLPNVQKMLIYLCCTLFNYSIYINDNIGQCKTKSRESRILKGAKEKSFPVL